MGLFSGKKKTYVNTSISRMVEDEDMFDIVKGARDIVEAVQMLIEKANSNGGRDNIGVVLAEPLADEVSAW